VAGSYYSDDADLFIDPSRLVELTDSVNAPGAPGQGVVDRAGIKAQRLIDQKLRGKYVVPFDPGAVPPEIAELHQEIKRYFVFAYRDNLPIPDEVAESFKLAVADLVDYADANGGLMLDAPLRAAADGTVAGGGGAISSDPAQPVLPPRIFGLGRDRLG
jgi:phage gp36-like protein